MLELYEAAEELGVEIYTGNIPSTKSFAIPGYVVLDFRLVGTVEERTRAAHELGHNAKAAFYCREDPTYIKKRCENKADRWAIKKLIPKDELDNAVSHGITEPWELAEYFNVTQDMMEKAMWFYTYGNLAMGAR